MHWILKDALIFRFMNKSYKLLYRSRPCYMISRRLALLPGPSQPSLLTPPGGFLRDPRSSRSTSAAGTGRWSSNCRNAISGRGGWRFQFRFVRETSGDNYPNDDYQINSARDWNSHITEKYGLYYNHCNRSVNVVSWFKCKIKIKQHTSSIEKHFIMDEISECLTE